MPRPESSKSARLPALRSVVLLGDSWHPGTFKFSEILARGGAAEAKRIAELAPLLQFDEPINIQFTSGTTGFPKGATLSHHNILNNGYFIGEAMRLTPEDRLCIPVPLYHCFGMVLGNLAAVTHGACMVFPGEGFDPLVTLETVAEERCTALHGVPTMFIAELDHPDFEKFDLKSLRTGIMAGSPCPIEVMKRCVAKMNLSEITIAYGMTETSPVSFQSSTEDPLERRVSTVGRIQPHLEVKIVDPGAVVPTGTPGELLTRGYSVMLGYWGDEERNREAIDATAGCTPATSPPSTPRATATSSAASRTWSSAAARTSIRARSRSSCYRHPKIAAVQVVGVPDPNTARRSAPGSSCGPVRLHRRGDS